MAWDPASGPTEDRLWESVSQTIVTHVLPALPDGWARQAAVGLVSLADYAGSRPADPIPARSAELAMVLGDHAVGSEPSEVLARCGRVLAAAATGDGGDGEVARRIRSVLVGYLDADLGVSAPLIEGFRGRLRGRELPPAPEAAGQEVAASPVSRLALQDFLARCRGASLLVTSMVRITAGHSRAMWRVVIDDGASYVVRVEQGGVFGTEGRAEAEVMKALNAAGFPAARVLWDEPTGSVLGQPLFVMEDLGLSDANPGGDERSIDDQSAASLVRLLARLHKLPWQALAKAGVRVPDPADATPDQVRRWAAVYRASTDAVPLLDEAEAWLVHNAPPLDRLAVVHGDAGPGNFVHRGGQALALTDFEFTHLGDPAEDWVFCAAMRGSRTMPRQAWAELFATHAGVELDEAAWRYWEAFNLFKGACANLSAGAAFATTTPAPNLLAVGTALHQSFLRRLADVVAPPAPG